MNICVVTPYFEANEDWIRQAHESVKAQTLPAHHVFVCDGSSPARIPDFRGTHIVLQRQYRDYGNTPRLIGCYHAVTLQVDAIAFLDADNWFYPEHLESLAAFARQNQLDACSSTRMLHRLDGSPMVKCPTINGRAYIDTNCLLVMKPAFGHLISWVLMSQEVAAGVDQLVWSHMMRAGARLGFLDRPTVAYRTRHMAHYEQAGEPPPPEAVRRSDLHGDRYH
jgi:hypothetical protein